MACRAIVIAVVFASSSALPSTLSSSKPSGRGVFVAVDSDGDVEEAADDVLLLQSQLGRLGERQEPGEEASAEEAPAEETAAGTPGQAAPGEEAPADEAPAAGEGGAGEADAGTAANDAAVDAAVTETLDAAEAAAAAAGQAAAEILSSGPSAEAPAPATIRDMIPVLSPVAPGAELRVSSAPQGRTAMETNIGRLVLVFVLLVPALAHLLQRELERRAEIASPHVVGKWGDYRQTHEGIRIERGGFSPFSLFGNGWKEQIGEGSIALNVLSGVSTSLICIPQAISFSFVLGVAPLNGIWASGIMGLFTALIGGRPGSISCAAAATAVVLQEISRDPSLGLGPMALAVGICGTIQLLVGVLRLSRFAALMPHTVMLGFMNGLAVLIVLGQLPLFQDRATGHWVEDEMLHGMVWTCLVSIVATVLFNLIPVVGHYIPAPLVAVAVASAYCFFTGGMFPVRSLEDVAGGPNAFAGGWAALPELNFPAGEVAWDDGEMWRRCTIVGAQMALVGLMESLLTMSLVDQLTDTYGVPQAEVVGQGLGNIACSLFGLQGGCTVVGQSLVNISSGGRSRVSAVTNSVCLLLCAVFFWPFIGRLPVAAVVSVMFLVGINTFCWGLFRLVQQTSLADSLVIVLVTFLTVFSDLALALIVGVILSAALFAWRSAQDAVLEVSTTGEGHVVKLRGPLFFASASSFESQIRSERIAEKFVLLDFTGGQVLDRPGLEAVAAVCDRLQGAGKQVTRRGLPKEAEEALGLLVATPYAVYKPAGTLPGSAPNMARPAAAAVAGRLYHHQPEAERIHPTLKASGAPPRQGRGSAGTRSNTSLSGSPPGATVPPSAAVPRSEPNVTYVNRGPQSPSRAQY